MEKQNQVYSKAAVEEALRLTAMGCAGILQSADAKESLEKLPEDLSKLVMAATVAARKVQSSVFESVIGKLGKISEFTKDPEKRVDSSSIDLDVLNAIVENAKREAKK